MSTKKWGPHAWIFLSAVALGFHLQEKTNPVAKKKHYKSFFALLRYTLPCSFCRDSYQDYFRKLNIEKYMDSKKQWCMIRFVYDLKECVNKKLRKQEKKLFDDQFKKLPAHKKADKAYVQRLRKRIFTTKNSPRYEQFLKKVLEMRPKVCSNKIGSCVRGDSHREMLKLAPRAVTPKKSKKMQ